MKQIQRPVMFTVVFGILAGMAFIPMTIILAGIFSWQTSFNLVIWCFLSVYGVFLAKWRKIGLMPLIFPMALLLVITLYGVSIPLFLLISLGILAWIRSGVSLQNPGLRVLFTEMITSVGGGALVAWFTPNTSASWAIGTFLFFLVQALYFPLMGNPDKDITGDSTADPFETARREAEKILFDRI